MIGERSTFLRSVQTVADLAVVVVAWLIAYPIRFNFIPLLIDHVPPFAHYAALAALALLVWAVVLRLRPLLGGGLAAGLQRDLFWGLRNHLLAFVTFVVVTFFISAYKPSRIVLVIFLTLSTLGIVGVRVAMHRWQLARLRRGEGVTRCLVVGTGKLARSLVERLHRRADLGQVVQGFLADRQEEVGTEIDGLPVLATVEEVQRVAEEKNVQRVYVALPISAHDRLSAVLNNLEEEMIDVKVVVDLMDFVVLRSAVEDFEGLPVISLKQTPMSGWGAALKRAFDIAFAGTVMIFGAPVFAAISIAVKLSSPGPVFYGQERMGLDGKVFDIFKFRSMRADAESDTGAVWAREDDPRRTRIGTFLRRTNLDELPQFWNVLKGEMSVVGPRPERPVFIEEFRTEIPKYMLRHKVKAGLTGWAQVKGWRGDTDLRPRIECDLYYIENWSFWLDLRIIWMTLFSKAARENAY
ncbi:MAG: undecaprenyl-phosphate glucose phosphotransferase [Candidatus Lernaella stagnicola]|nr:undecaprenyl-phosphate glucose phosphotransferase [Candidatus Lernaella stagnicola]